MCSVCTMEFGWVYGVGGAGNLTTTSAGEHLIPLICYSSAAAVAEWACTSGVVPNGTCTS
jgi:hypothetical protein